MPTNTDGHACTPIARVQIIGNTRAGVAVQIQTHENRPVAPGHDDR